MGNTHSMSLRQAVDLGLRWNLLPGYRQQTKGNIYIRDNEHLTTL